MFRFKNQYFCLCKINKTEACEHPLFYAQQGNCWPNNSKGCRALIHKISGIIWQSSLYLAGTNCETRDATIIVIIEYTSRAYYSYFTDYIICIANKLPTIMFIGIMCEGRCEWNWIEYRSLWTICSLSRLEMIDALYNVLLARSDCDLWLW